MIRILARSSLISLADTVGEAFANLHRQGIRSFLALLGILIGTAAIVAMISIGQMAQTETMKMFSAMGVNVLQIRSSAAGGGGAGLSRDTLEGLVGQVPDVALVAPAVVGVGAISFGREQVTLSIAGVTPTLPVLVGLRLNRGRFPGQIEDSSLVAVVGAQLAERLSKPGAPLELGSQIWVKGYGLTVIGILEPAQSTAIDAADYNNTVLTPMGNAGRLSLGTGQNVAMVRLAPSADSKAASDRIIAALTTDKVAIQVQRASDVVAMVNAQKTVHSRLLAAIGGISLLVGGIGVMNVMLMGVMERRREIGLRAAIGATPGDVQRMFVIEAGVLACAGGVAGGLIGIAAAWLFARTSAWSFGVEPQVVLLGPGMAAVVGLVFGFYPALRASRLRPVEALRGD